MLFSLTTEDKKHFKPKQIVTSAVHTFYIFLKLSVCGLLSMLKKCPSVDSGSNQLIFAYVYFVIDCIMYSKTALSLTVQN